MARKDKFRPYTGRSNRTKNMLIGLLALVLFCVFLAYTYQTDGDFRSAVGSLTAVFRGESRPRATEPTGAADPADPTAPTDPGGATAPTGAAQFSQAAVSGNLLYRTWDQLADPASAVEIARQGGFDGLLVDLKQNGGSIVYQSELDSAAVAQAMVARAYDLRALASLCEQDGLYLVGRLSTFTDHIAPGALQGSGVSVASGVVFLDGNYRRSLDPYKARALDYLTALTEEAASMGVKEILLSDLAFPHYGKISLIVYDGERDKRDQLLYCIGRLQETARQVGVAVSVELPLTVFLDSAYAQASGQDFVLTGRLSAGVTLRSGMSAELVTEEELLQLREAVAQLPEDLTRSMVLSAETVELALPVFTQTAASRLFFVEAAA